MGVYVSLLSKSHLWVDSDQGIRSVVELFLQRNNDGLELTSGLFLYETGNLKIENVFCFEVCIFTLSGNGTV